MKQISLSLFLFSLLTISSCRRNLDDGQLVYEGKWESAEHTLIIYSHGKGACIQKKLRLRCNGYVTITDHKMVFTSSSLDSHVFRVKFTIQQKPAVDANGITYMLLDGERFEQ
ncbi:hypothetical protein Q0590_06760 [Rhodocytophaga aerolata]|uniref:Lipoprotein n=1 Tax=Rhodocytophaga aerolata TaxID=455078 RepID=A0ABT8R5J9_9BACT|nr:hypothetical protein [Rhodocytophaga aerolata]MDO1445945.1 hypothetical protein [Rhodocytophaga aerolata]